MKIFSPCFYSNRNVLTKHYFGLLFFHVLLFFLLAAPTADAGVRNFTNTNAVLSLALEGETLLAGTEGGLVVWDLKKKTYHTISTSEGLPNNKVTSILIDPEKGDWWLGTHRGVCRYDKKKWIAYGIKNGLNSMWINRVYQDHQGIVWVGTRRGVDWFDRYEWHSLFPNADRGPLRVYGLAQEKDGRWWFADRGKGIFRLDPDFSLQQYDRVNNIPSLFNRRVVVDHDGTVWFGTYRGVVSYDGKAWKRYGLSEGLTSFQVNEIFVDGNNSLWAGTTHGCSRLVDGRWVSLDQKDGLPGDYVTSFAEDSRRRIYIGTRRGIAVFQDGKIVSPLLTDAPFQGVVFTDAARQRDGTLWFAATDGGGIVSYDGRRWRTFGHSEGLSDENVLCLAVDGKDRLWAGTHHGLFRYTSGRWDPVPVGEGKTAVNIYAVAFQQEEILLGTDRGLLFLDPDGRRKITTANGLPDNTVLSIWIDRDRCFVGTRTGLAVLKESKVAVINELNGHTVTSIFRSKGDILYAGTEYGLFRIEKDHVRRFGVSDGLFDLRIQKLTADDGGRLWIATQRGLCKFDGTQFECFTRDEGFADDQINAVVLDRKGRKWLATIQGVTCFDDVIRFDRSRYVGVAAKAVLILRDDPSNRDPGLRERVSVILKNMTLNREIEAKLIETGPDSGIFRASLAFAANAVREKTGNKIPVDGNRTNRILAKINKPGSDHLGAVIFWRDDFQTGNINGDAIVSRQDAILADRVVSGLSDPPVNDRSDLSHDGKVGKLDIEYAREVSAGVIQPWQMIENQGPVRVPGIIASRKGTGRMFTNEDLPWTFRRIEAAKGGTITLENLSLYVPPHALKEDTVITITRGERTPSPSDISVYPVGAGFNLYPSGLKFRKPVRLSIQVKQTELEKTGVSDLLALAVGSWNGKGYDALPSYPFFQQNRIIGFIHGFPDTLLRPDRPANARTRTAPVFSYLYPSNYFSLITVQEGGGVKISESGSEIRLTGAGLKEHGPFRFFLIDGRKQELILDRQPVTGREAERLLNTIIHKERSGTVNTGASLILLSSSSAGGGVIEPYAPYRFGLIGKDAEGNRAELYSTFRLTEPKRLKSLKILPEKINLSRGSRFRFIGLGISEDGTEWPGLDVAWTTHSPGVSINVQGVLSCDREGGGSVNVSCAGLTASAEYSIAEKPELTRILVAPRVQVVRVNEKRDYRGVGIDQYGHRMKIRPQWSVENSGGEGVIDAEGHFTAKREGIYFLKAKEGNISTSVISFIGGCTWCHFMK